jgi:hypothetical protein
LQALHQYLWTVVVQVALVDAHVILEDLFVGVQVALVDQDQLMDVHVILVVGFRLHLW